MYRKCVAPNTCVCEQGYIWNEQTKKCIPDCGTCPPHSYCVSPGHCKCENGYEKNSQGLCVPTCDCVRGSCVDGKCSCPPEYWGPKCENKFCTCFDFYSNDTRTCANNGKWFVNFSILSRFVFFTFSILVSKWILVFATLVGLEVDAIFLFVSECLPLLPKKYAVAMVFVLV